MRQIESFEDAMKGVVTYEFQNGKRVQFDVHAVQKYGLPALLREAGVADLVPNERIPVMQHGRKIGTVSPAFDPMFIESTSPWYHPRRGDFRRDGGAWVASNTLGPGDLEAVPGFVFTHD